MIKTMFSQYRRMIIICSLLTIFPGVISMVGNTFSELPRFMPFLSLSYFILFWIVIPLTFRDPRQLDQNPKVIHLELWIFPALSWMTWLISLLLSANQTDLLLPAMDIVFGLFFIIFGNYLPKTRPNSSFGIRIPWTYTSVENWRQSNRLGGKLFVAGGFILLLSACWPSLLFWILPAVILVLITVPSVYSYCFYRKQLKEKQIPPVTGKQLRSFQLAGAAVILLLVFAGFMLFTGDVRCQIEPNEIVLSASYAGSTAVKYDEVESIRMEENFDPGIRIFGVENLKIQGGKFQNKENGTYTLYGEVGADHAIVLKTESGVVVLSLRDDALLDQIYDELKTKVENRD